ncbi:MAG: polysaccharide deacetylase family protein [Candidatus Sumerlaeaceae bacterium]|nr:polysaccharide deacetylase family protein [Candidatus Sumerlaeaceae bacterium]
MGRSTLRSCFFGVTITAFLACACLSKAQVPVLLYHAHSSFGYSASLFTQHMDFLKNNGYNTITPDELLDWMEYDAPLPPRPILITMDDNYIPVYDEVFPILKARGMVAVNFAHTNYVGVITGSGDHCDWNEIKTMENAGVIFTESHTKSHQYLTSLSNTVAQDEIVGSKSAIDSNLPGKVCRYLAYPYGVYSATHVSMAMAAGYRAAFTTTDQKAYRTTPRYEIGRTTIGNDSVATFASKIGFSSLPTPPGAGFTLDNTDPNCTITASGAWTVSTAGSPYGTNAVVKSAGTGTHSVRWAVKLRQPGTYKVYARWTSAPDRATNATYQITHATGTSSVVVNQQTGGGQWQVLGTFGFSPSAPAQVLISDAANGTVSADAVWFEPAVSKCAPGWELYD